MITSVVNYEGFTATVRKPSRRAALIRAAWSKKMIEIDPLIVEIKLSDIMGDKLDDEVASLSSEALIHTMTANDFLVVAPDILSITGEGAPRWSNDIGVDNKTLEGMYNFFLDDDGLFAAAHAEMQRLTQPISNPVEKPEESLSEKEKTDPN